ncbi:Lrp/AsnC family transcriptional regulator [Azohydromonas sp.]|uniref:Lrp/AsnC family transcriptional regulator n=1 Tax=Azohydromonas sp. TaxID=1872666 RepID=UPI002CF7E10F|nr:Lrp/AsnC family transcriptional regulator [Azohydromonas sp.]HMM86533.1 AsnC family transcriptional regulator [Azohydromonas sp.]
MAAVTRPGRAAALADFDRRLLEATRDGLPLVSRPYDEIARRLGTSGAQVRARLGTLLRDGALLRIGVLPDAQQVGLGRHALSVWDVDDRRVDELGDKVAAFGFVLRCCRRPRRAPDWPYNLFAVLHGRDTAEIDRGVLQILCLLADACRGHEVLHRERVLKRAP